MRKRYRLGGLQVNKPTLAQTKLVLIIKKTFEKREKEESIGVGIVLCLLSPCPLLMV